MNQFFERRAGIALALFVALVIIWLAAVIFSDPYLYTYNQGNAAYFVQVLHNISHGIGPEHTTKANGSLYYHTNKFYYASAFSVIPQILPLVILPPLYLIYPYPPMHVFIVAVIVLLLGPAGIFLALRALGGSKKMALLGAMGYAILPWVLLSVLYQGFFDNLSYAVYPFVFAFLFRKDWKLFYVSIILLALINMTYTFAAIALGVTIAVFFRHIRQGIITSLIGLLILAGDIRIVQEALHCIGSNPLPTSGIFTEFLSMCGAKSLFESARFYVLYVGCVMMTVFFLPVIGIWNGKRVDWKVVGMLFFVLTGVFMGLFRSYHWAFHRNANLVIPIYLSAFMVYTSAGPASPGRDKRRKIAIGTCLFLAVFISSTSFMAYRTLRAEAHRDNNTTFNNILALINKNIPQDASLAYRVDAGLEAYLTNRQKAWPLGYHPEGVEYYVIQTAAVESITEDFPGWKGYLSKIGADKKMRLLYKDSRLVIYKNMAPIPIPRPENCMGWNILLKAFVPRIGEKFL